MSLSSKTELARALFRSTPPDSVTRISGTATADSSDGTVTVQLEDGDVIEVGTIGSVSAGDTVTIHVQRGEAQVIASEGWGDAMQAAVDEAQAIAEATGQHFWHDSNGAHVTEVTADQWAQSQTGHNILVNSLGILLRKALNYIAAWTGSALSFYDGNGNAASNVTASFGSAGAQIGKVGESHIEMDYHSMRMLDRGGNEYFRVADLADSDSYVQYTFYGDGATVTWELPADGLSLGVPDVMLYDSGGQSAGRPSDAEVGYNAGVYYIRILPAVASGYYAVAKIEITSTSVPYVTFGTRGDGNIGMNSAALGESLVAATKDQTVVGKFNVEDYDGQNALIIGNGTADNARSNALTVDWSGNVEAAGDVSGATLSSAGGLSLYGGTAFEDMLVSDSFDKTIGSVSANGGTKALVYDVTKTGYKALAAVGFYLSGASRLHIYRMRLTAANEVTVNLVNKDTAATSATAKLYIDVLYVKTA